LIRAYDLTTVINVDLGEIPQERGC
jgi:hypothetical protein